MTSTILRCSLPYWRHLDKKCSKSDVTEVERALENAGVIYERFSFIRDNYATGVRKITPIVELEFTSSQLTWITHRLHQNRAKLITYLAERFKPIPDAIHYYPHKEEDWVEFTEDFTNFDLSLRIMLEFILHLDNE